MFLSYSNPPFYYPEITVYGEAAETDGLTVRGAISGVGLLVFGMFWECGNIWSPEPSVSTSWSASDSVITTTWDDSETSITTTWTEVFEGEC